MSNGKLQFTTILLSLLVGTPACSANIPPPVTGASASQAEGAAGVTHRYLGIPYAEPPKGTRRFAPPVPVPLDGGFHRGTTLFSEYGPQCPQGQRSPRSVPTATMDEDCLSLNVWVPPGAAPATPAAVMVFIHGGGFQTGASSLTLYDGEALATLGGVVVVSLNYRIGTLGFLAHPALAAVNGFSGNFGLLDQIAALQWVQRHIAVFGGDPGRVTIFGESAGAMSVCALLVSPRAKGLFHRAIAESGSCPIRSRSEQESRGLEIAKELGCAKGKARDPVECLRAIPVGDLVAAQPEGIAADVEDLPSPSTLNYLPTVDGVVLTERPQSTIEKGLHNRVPVIVGSNAEELPPVPQLFPGASAATIEQEIRAAIPSPGSRTVPRATYDPSKFRAPLFAAAALRTDSQFTCPGLELARLVSLRDPAYHYQFAQGLPLGRGRLPSIHGAELLFLFGSFAAIATGGHALLEPSSADRSLSKEMMLRWSGFAKTGVPSAPGRPAWPALRPRGPSDEGEARIRFELPEVPSTTSRSAECDALIAGQENLYRIAAPVPAAGAVPSVRLVVKGESYTGRATALRHRLLVYQHGGRVRVGDLFAVSASPVGGTLQTGDHCVVEHDGRQVVDFTVGASGAVRQTTRRAERRGSTRLCGHCYGSRPDGFTRRGVCTELRVE